MKFKFLIFILLVGLIFSYFYFDELSYSPLKDKDFQILFPKYKEIEKVSSKNFLGISFKSEVYEIYQYKVSGSIINSSYPEYKNEWENEEITNEIITTKWLKCPIDSTSYKLFEFTLTANNDKEIDMISLFNTELTNPENYYSTVYFNELEHYFLLYCSKREMLYYIRRKGF